MLQLHLAFGDISQSNYNKRNSSRDYVYSVSDCGECEILEGG